MALWFIMQNYISFSWCGCIPKQHNKSIKQKSWLTWNRFPYPLKCSFLFWWWVRWICCYCLIVGCYYCLTWSYLRRLTWICLWWWQFTCGLVFTILVAMTGLDSMILSFKTWLFSHHFSSLFVPFFLGLPCCLFMDGGCRLTTSVFVHRVSPLTR